MRHNTQKRSGFTLIELLVVLGILGLLTAMLFPVFARAREKGRQTVCLSNERQLGMAFLMYTHDNDGAYMLSVGDDWAAYIYPYIKSVDIYHCPSDPTTAQPPFYPVSYGRNVNIGAVLRNPAQIVPISEAQVSPKTVLLFEVVHSTAQITTRGEGWTQTAAPLSCSVGGNGDILELDGCLMSNGAQFSINKDARYATGPLSMYDPAGTESAYYEGAGRHSDGSNFLFSDGHSQWLPPKRVSAGVAGDNCWLNGRYSGAAGCAAGSENNAFAATFSPR